MATQLLHIVYFLSCLCLVIVSLQAEQFFRGRIHQDQSVFHNARVYTVRNSHDAMQQLEKYGYLKCKIGRRKRQAPFPGVISESHGSDSRNGVVPGEVVTEEGGQEVICNSTQLREGIIRYQNKYQLNLTGVLDDDTLRFMSNSRCGNKDSETELVNPDMHDPGPLIEEGRNDSTRSKRTARATPEEGSSEELKNTRLWRRSAGDSTLMQVIAPRKVKTTLERRQEMLQEYLDKYSHEDPIIYKPVTDQERQKRSIVVNNRTGAAQMFKKKILKWRLLNSGYSTRIPVNDQRATIHLAFRMWSEVIPLKFKEDTLSDIREIDIEIAFGRGTHQNCPKRFDGSGGEVAHSWHAGNVHFDDEENYKSINTYTEDGLYLLKVAVHEIGHVLGLAHTNKSYSIMYAIYHKHFSPQPNFELGWEDRKEIQKLYGVCKGSFNVVFDWVRKRANSQFIYNTFFFRGNRFWMYENHANRTRFGDPQFIPDKWKHLPGNLDAYVHVWYYSHVAGAVINEAFFFKGEEYFKFNSEKGKVVDGFPHSIRTDFPAKNESWEPIPANIDSVFFDMRDKNIYFFKGEWVYVFDPKAVDEDYGCCERKVLIQDEYPAYEGELGLPANLDSVYYSYKDYSMYFIKGEDVWKNMLFTPRNSTTQNKVMYIGKWYQKWYDICDWISETPGFGVV